MKKIYQHQNKFYAANPFSFWGTSIVGEGLRP